MKSLDRLKRFNVPPYVISLEDNIQSWRECGETVEIIPKKGDFDVLYVEKKHIPFSISNKYSFSSITRIVSEGGMTKLIEMYRRLKRMECILGWKGSVRLQPVFTKHPVHEKLSMYIDDFKSEDRLIKVLNANHGLINILKDLKPILEITLDSLPKGAKVSDKGDLISQMVTYYMNPEKIEWITSFELIFPISITKYDKIVQSIFDIHNVISKSIREVTRNLYSSL